MLSSTLRWVWFLNEVADSRTVSNISLSNGSSKFERSFVFCFMSISKTTFLLYKNSNREYFWTQWAKSSPSIIWPIGRIAIQYFYWLILNCFVLFFNKVIRLWVVCARHTLDGASKTMHSTETVLTNYWPWSFIWMVKQPCLHISSYKNCETVVAFLSLSCFALYHLLK